MRSYLESLGIVLKFIAGFAAVVLGFLVYVSLWIYVWPLAIIASVLILAGLVELDKSLLPRNPRQDQIKGMVRGAGQASTIGPPPKVRP